MKIDLNTGLLDSARQIASPNCDSRKADEAIDLIVIHNISLPPGQFGGQGVEQLFTNCLEPDEHPYFADICTLQVSSHLFIRRDGEIIQFVPFHQRAWHAGVSSYQQREACNDFSIGIELEGTDELPYSDPQYQVLTEVINALCDTYPTLNTSRITGHCDIAPTRKTDPGPAFDWNRLKKQLNVDNFEPAE